MFAYFLTLPLLVNPAGVNAPIYDVSKVAFNPVAFETPVNLGALQSSYEGGQVVALDTDVKLQTARFGPAAAHLVNPVFSVEELN
jgi:hypothetical protein